MYSAHNEGESVVAERFIRTLKNKVQKHMTVVSKNVYLVVLGDIIDKYNNKYHEKLKSRLLILNQIFMLNTVLILMLKILNLK